MTLASITACSALKKGTDVFFAAFAKNASVPFLRARATNADTGIHGKLRSTILLAFALLAHAEIIYRIAASVDTKVITQSELELQIRVAAFQDGVKPDFSPKNKQATLDKMIDQKLVRRDLENSRYPLPDPAELVPAIDQFKKTHFKDEAGYQRGLTEYGITDQDFREELLWERTLLSFIELRFESGVQVTDPEISDYFEKTTKPAFQAAHPGQTVQLDDYRDQIERQLAAERADKQMETWLAGAHRRAQITIHPEVLR